MAYPINESFVTAPSGSFAALNSGSAGTATHEVGTNSLLLQSAVGDTTLWRVLAAGLTSEFTFEADLELVADAWGNKHYGLWLSTNEAPRQEKGVRFTSYTPYNLDVRDFDYSANTERPKVSTPAVPTAGVVTWKIEAKSYGVGWRISLRIGGSTFYEGFYDNVYGVMPPLMPAIMVYGCTVRVHEVRGYAATTFQNNLTSRVLQPTIGALSLGSQGKQAGPPRSVSPTFERGWRNIYQGGSGEVSGTTMLNNVIYPRKQVRLFNKSTALLVAETWSDSVGAYVFQNIDSSQEYFVVSHDETGAQEAVVKDRVRP